MARVNLDDEAFGDWRFRRLAQLMGGGVSRFDARGRCEEVWWHCYRQQSHLLSQGQIDGIAEWPNFWQLMIGAELAERADDAENGMIRVRGLTGRIEYLGKLRKNARKGGLARRKQMGRQMGSSGSAGASPPSPSPSPSPSPAPAQVDRSDPTLPGFAASAAPPTNGNGKVKALALQVWDDFNRVRRETFPGARPIKPAEKLIKRVADLLSEYTPADCTAVIGYYAAQAKADPSQRKWFNAVTPFRPDNFARALSMAGMDAAPKPKHTGRG